MNKEFDFLNIISNTLDNSSFLGDDCAYLKNYKLAISKDCLIEDVHFSLKYMNTYEIAKKALLVNISDILASGAKPKYALIGLSGKLDNDFIKNFYLGINEIAKKFKLEIIGGDLTSGDKISISVTILGDYKNRKISSRKNAKKDYVLAVVGEFGSSANGLFELQQGKKESYFISYHKEPKLYPKISSKIAKTVKKPYAMMDSSDGLIDCLYQISTKSNVKIEIDYNLIPKKTTNKNFVLSGGEDYALVVALDKSDFKKIPNLIQIGSCKSGKGIFVDGKEIKYNSFQHFN